VSPETEKGFGTGLREQLERRRRKGEHDGGHEPELDLGVDLDAPPAAAVAVAEPQVQQLVETGPELDHLRAELKASLERERDLRAALAEQVQAYERELDAGRDYAVRAAELDQRAVKLSAAESALEERERTLDELRAEVESERGRVDAAAVELASAEAATAERAAYVEAKTEELKSAERERQRADHELGKQQQSIVER
jgi:hypothetical protein